MLEKLKFPKERKDRDMLEFADYNDSKIKEGLMYLPEGLAYLSGAYEGGLAISEYVSEGGVIDIRSAVAVACCFGIGYLLRKYRKKKLGEENL